MKIESDDPKENCEVSTKTNANKLTYNYTFPNDPRQNYQETYVYAGNFSYHNNASPLFFIRLRTPSSVTVNTAPKEDEIYSSAKQKSGFRY